MRFERGIRRIFGNQIHHPIGRGAGATLEFLTRGQTILRAFDRFDELDGRSQFRFKFSVFAPLFRNYAQNHQARANDEQARHCKQYGHRALDDGVEHGSVADLEDRQKRFLGNLDVADLLHAFLAFFLALEQLAFARNVAAVALGRHVLSHRR